MTDDPWVMYLVVRKDVRWDIAAACALAGGATVACARAYAEDPRFAAAFEAWYATSFRKVALRADREHFAEILAREPGATADWEGEIALTCLPPRRRSQAGDLLSWLPGFTDARRPEAPTPPPPPDVHALTYVLNGELRMTQGKAMAQAGHGALLCADSPAGDRGPRAADWAAWAEAGRPGRVVRADADTFAAVKALPDAAVVRDAGLTQVEPGAETVVCLPPAPEAGLPRALASVLNSPR
jgi:peptidyl-tRNA hydrolase